MKPSGNMATDLNKVGGIPQVLKILMENNLLNTECLTITGNTIGDELSKLKNNSLDGQDVRSFSNHFTKKASCNFKGNLSPEGCVAKITGLKNPKITGPAKVFDSESDAMDAIISKKLIMVTLL